MSNSIAGAVRGRPTAHRMSRHSTQQVALRAARFIAEQEAAEKRSVWPFVRWALTRVLALSVVLGTGYVVYDWSSSDQFEVHSVQVSGNTLLLSVDVVAASGVVGTNLFWVNRSDVQQRLRSLPAIQRVEVTPLLPNTLAVTLVERRPAAIWLSGNQAYIVDQDGMVLKLADPNAAQQDLQSLAQSLSAQAGGSLPIVVGLNGVALAPGDRVEARALTMTAQLGSLLPPVGLQPVEFDWSPDTGLEVQTSRGWRVRFDPRQDAGPQIQTLTSITQYLARTDRSVQLIDLRFGDRPYVR